MKTAREFQLALGKLLNQVRFQNKWNSATFKKVAHTVGLSKAEAARFYQALVEMNLLTFDKQRRTMITQFNVIIWKNEDSKMLLIKEIMDMFPNLQQTRGRVKGKKYPAKEIKETITLANFRAAELVAELRSRGFDVEASRKVVTVEKL